MSFDIAQIFSYLFCFISALSVHEWAHAFAAKKYGDDTAESLGRLTLNPLAHIDPLGTIILPLAGALTGFPLIGWAKPVPVNPRNFIGDVKSANMVIAFAGPLSNIIMCLISCIILAIYIVFGSGLITPDNFFFPLTALIQDFILINAILAIFNLLPLPPLDGAAVVGGFLPDDLGEKYEEFIAPYGLFILLFLFWTGVLSWVGPLSASLANFFLNASSAGFRAFIS